MRRFLTSLALMAVAVGCAPSEATQPATSTTTTARDRYTQVPDRSYMTTSTVPGHAEFIRRCAEGYAAGHPINVVDGKMCPESYQP
jgi:ABC-type glycerol-3-phosphate transport system substrate-binding protein